MAITPKKKITSYFDPITYSDSAKQNLSGLVAAPTSTVNLAKQRADLGLTAPTKPVPVASAGPITSTIPGRPTPLNPLFTGSSNPSASPVSVPMGETGRAPSSQSPIPSNWLRPDGTQKDPDEIANEIASTLKNVHESPDVGRLAMQDFSTADKSAQDLRTDARTIGNTRNDIAAGETDPYKVASQSGVAYSPAELSAIEKAYAGIYDPALSSALSKVEAKQASDKAAASANEPFTLGKDQVRYAADGTPIAVGINSGDTTTGTYVAGQNPTVDAFVKGIKIGTYKASDVPDEYKALVAQGTAATAPAVSKSSNDAISVINQLLGSNNLEDIVGFRISDPSSLFPGTAVQPTQNLAKQLQGLLSLENRGQLKGSGAISDFEFRVLGDASSALGIDKNGRTNLQVGDVGLTDQEIMDLHEQKFTPEEIRAAASPTAFSPVGNTTASAGNKPQRHNNPGNVKEGGLADSLATGKDEEGHLIFPDADTGFKALSLDLTAKLNGGSRYLPANPTIAQLGKVYAEDPNWPVKVAQMLGVSPTTPTKSVPFQNLIRAIATQEGFYA